MGSLGRPPVREIGGKARTLVELQRAGFPVPDFLCSPSHLAHAVDCLGLPLAVRSSASVEDGREVSFAGQFETYLNLGTLEQVEHAVRKCKESVKAPSVAEYCRRSGINLSSLHMEVIVQRMVQPELAGVAFTVNPVTGAEEVVIEACEGLADNLLAGRTASLLRDHPLIRKYAPEIDRVARKIHRHFGVPQDVEFAIEDGKLYILQSRPITRIAFAPDTGEWTNADWREGGVSSGVCTPLMWSLYDFIWENTLKGFLREIKLLGQDFQAGRMFFGRPYWNVGAVKQCLAKLPGFAERQFDEDLSLQIDYEGDGICTRVTPGGIIKTLPAVFAIKSIWKKQERFDREFLAAGFDAIARKYERISGDVEAAFRNLIQDAYWTIESNYFRTIYCASLAKLDFKSSFPNADYLALMGDLPEIKHLEPTRVLRKMAARGETDVAPLLKRFRHHSRRELDIRVPRWDEDREWVEKLLREYSGSTGADPHSTYECDRAEALAHISWHKRGSFRRKLDRLRTFIWLREEMRDLSSRMYYLIRRYVVAIANRRGIGDNIFFMTFQEILEDDRSNIERNRETYESYRNFKAPGEIGSHFTFNGCAPQGTRRGIGASPGTVRGVARVARTLEEAMSIEKGAILVCPFTDPGWTPILDRAAGVVTETGGLLSHAAVICREYGIPAVLGLSGATAGIPDGSTVIVHGSEGYVELVD